MAHYPNVVILLPGILGSTLTGPGGDIIWGTSPSTLLKHLSTFGNGFEPLKLVGDDPAIDHLDDGIRASVPIADLHLIPGLWKIDGYSKLRTTLVGDLELEGGRNYFEFAYDWRRDNRVAARALERASRLWLSRWRESSGNQSAKLVLVAHSMGGLVARHFVEVLGGWRDTAHLITFGTPFRGAPKALGALSNGVKIAGIVDLSDVVRSMTSVYQLLPTYRAHIGEDFQPSRLGQVQNIPNLSMGKVTAATTFHDEITAAQSENVKSEGYARDFRVIPFIGMGQGTSNFARSAPGGVELLRRHAGLDHGGDGTVPRISALPAEMADDAGAFFIADAHASLQNSAAALFHLTNRLRGATIDYQAFRGAPTDSIGLDIEDAYPANQSMELAARTTAYRQGLRFTVVDVGTGSSVSDGWLWSIGSNEYRGTVTLAQGDYRIQVSGEGMSPVTDVFVVY